MSNRSDKSVGVSPYAAMKLCHEKQIDLIGRYQAGKIGPSAFVQDFMLSIGATPDAAAEAATVAITEPGHPLDLVWEEGEAVDSLFANLPGCRCPVMENRMAKSSSDIDFGLCPPFPGIPDSSFELREAGPEVFRRFSEVQLTARFPNSPEATGKPAPAASDLFSGV